MGMATAAGGSGGHKGYGQPVALFTLTKGSSVALIDALQLGLVAEEEPTEC